jgi:hypothetical protein
MAQESLTRHFYNCFLSIKLATLSCAKEIKDNEVNKMFWFSFAGICNLVIC